MKFVKRLLIFIVIVAVVAISYFAVDRIYII